MAYLILHYPLMKKLQADGQAVRAFGVSRYQCGSFRDRAPGMGFAPCATIPETSQEQATSPIIEQGNQSKIIDHQRSVIN
ncbi:Hypothetical protein PHPALM_3134 [Phytophthora palmivora]|uniref:Uncharacterized protein n=1 Tax=Phytophthora palmivora TaxID=4796 RepID=A0A2P4YN68_9STRA|nr:Hypothetical protein PHPALM_3134 [Phytophthora palmivora]